MSEPRGTLSPSSSRGTRGSMHEKPQVGGRRDQTTALPRVINHETRLYVFY